MLRPAREPGPLEVSPEVIGALARLVGADRALAEHEGKKVGALDVRPVLSLEAVETLEEHLRARVPDDALAIYAVRARWLARFDLGKVGSFCEQAWELGLSKARVVLGPAFGTMSSSPEAGGRWACIPRRPDRGHPLRVTFFDPEDKTEGDATTLAGFLEQPMDKLMEELVEADEETMFAIETAGDAIDLVPRLERTLVLPHDGPGAAGKRVRHARFGDGVVLRALPESDKLEIDFGEGGVRVLIARFVQDLEAR